MSQKHDDIVIVAFGRSAFDKFGGVLKSTPTADLVTLMIKELLKRSGLNGEQIDEVNLGLCSLGEANTQSGIIARQGLLAAGLPNSTLSINIDRACCSSTTALQIACNNLKLGEAEICMAVGTDNQSNAPRLLPSKYRWEGEKLGTMQLLDPLFGAGWKAAKPVAVDAGEVALKYGVTREMQDEWAVRSHKRWFEAKERGYFDKEIFPIEVSQGKKKPSIVFDTDATPRRDTNMESLAKLQTVYGSPTCTAGNAPPYGAGVSGVIVTTRKKAEELGLPVYAQILRVQSIAAPPNDIATAPAFAIKAALEKTGLKLEDMKNIEINEAFAAMPLVSTKILGGGDQEKDGDLEKIQKLRDITNVNGGAVAIGHPTGASGIRLVMVCLQELKRLGGGYGVAALCGGLAQADAIVLKVD